MENNNQPNVENRFSRRNIMVWVVVFFFAFGIVFALLTLWFNNEQIAQTTTITPQCCDAEATAQAARDALVAAETRIIRLEAEQYAASVAEATVEAQSTIEQEQLATAVAVIATMEAEKVARASQHQSRELAAYSLGEGEAMPQRSLLLAMEALRQTDDVGLPPEPVAEDAFFRALSTMGGIGLHGHTRNITAVGLSLDNHWLASASEDGTARLWDLIAPQIGTSSLLLPGHYGPVKDLAISPDSRWLVTAGQDGKLIIWDLTAENPAAAPIEYQVHEYGVNKVTFTPDNQWLIAGVNDHTVHLWETDGLPSTHEALILSGHESSVDNIVVSPDSRWLFTSSSDELNRWDLTAEDIASSLTPLTLTDLPITSGHHVFLEQVVISPNGRWLAAGLYEGSSSRVLVWDLSLPEKTTPAYTLKEDMPGSLSALIFSPNSQLLAASSAWGDNAIYIWDLAEEDFGVEPIVQDSHHVYVGGLTFSPDNEWLISSHEDNLVRVWETNRHNFQPIFLRGFEADAGIVTFSPDKQWLVAANDSRGSQSAENAIRLWDWSKFPDFQATPHVLDNRENWVTDIAMSADDRWLFALDQRLCDGESCDPPGDASATLWPLATEDEPSHPIDLFQNELYISDSALSANGRYLAVGGESQEVWLWDLSAPDPSKTKIILPGHTSQVDFVEFTPDNRWLVTASGYSIWTEGENDHTIRLWDIHDDNLADIDPVALSGHQADIAGIRLSDNGRWLLSWDDDDVIGIWDLWADDPALEPLLLILPEQSIGGSPTTIAISSDGHWLVTGGNFPDNIVRLYDLTAPEPEKEPIIITKYDDDPINSLIQENSFFFSENGRWLITGRTDSNHATQLWDLAAPDPTLDPFSLQCSRDQFVAISPDRNWILTNGNNLTACLWDIAHPDEGVTMHTLYNQPEFIPDYYQDYTYAQFSGDNKTLVTDSHDDFVLFWDLTAPDINKSANIIQHAGDFPWTWTVNGNGRFFARVSDRTQINLWDRQINQNSLELACETVGRNLTLQEWHTYFDATPYQKTCPDYPTPGES